MSSRPNLSPSLKHGNRGWLTMTSRRADTKPVSDLQGTLLQPLARQVLTEDSPEQNPWRFHVSSRRNTRPDRHRPPCPAPQYLQTVGLPMRHRKLRSSRRTRPETGILKMPVDTALPFHCTVRVRHTFTKTIFIVGILSTSPPTTCSERSQNARPTASSAVDWGHGGPNLPPPRGCPTRALQDRRRRDPPWYPWPGRASSRRCSSRRRSPL